MNPIVNIAIDAARKAGKLIIHNMGYMDTVTVSQKSHHDYVTEIDKRAELIIIDTIRKSHPNHGILAEESGSQEGKDEFVWIIDPLDGTTNYIHGFPHFAVSIAIQHKGKIEHGVIFDPIRQETFFASRGEGARLNERIRVSQCIKLENALIGTGFPFREPDYLQRYLHIFSNLLPKCRDMRRAGSAALDLAYVASGRIDGFWEFKLSPWDMAAGVLLIREAGGLISDFNGEETYMDTGNIIAATPKLLKQLLANTSEIRQ